MERKLQNIILPVRERFYLCWELFYKGSRSYVDREQYALRMGKFQMCDFTSYLNGCSYSKWKKYSNLKNVKLQLEIEGNFKIFLVGYHLDICNPIRKEFLSKEYCLESRQLIEIEYPENDETILGFEIVSYETCSVYEGAYIGEYEEDDIRNVVLSIATTTCHKEDFIISNMKVLKEEIIESRDKEIRDNIYIHVVDNGRTLNPKDWNEEHLKVHPNKNTGGAGGFARGMLESMHQTPVATHVLLMDDDVIVLPESIYRTYMLLTVLKLEYQEHFISGAMLYYEEMYKQHEDIGILCCREGVCRPLKPEFFHSKLKDNLMNETDFSGHSNKYAAWWYCCISVSNIRRNGLPLPLFVRCDDIEYSLRCKADIITMNGICIWHMGFVNKFNAAFDRYQPYRNLFIGNAINRFQGIDMLAFWKKAFNVELMRFNYDAAELLLWALEDYMKGPIFIEKNNGEQLLNECIKKNQKLVPLNKLNIEEIDLESLYIDWPRKFIDKCIYHATKNGQRFWPEKLLKKDKVAVPFDYGIVTQKQTLRKTLVFVNPYLKTGAIQEMDKKRFRKIYKRYIKDIHNYKINNEVIERAYRNQKKYLVSEEFWERYLEILFLDNRQ